MKDIVWFWEITFQDYHSHAVINKDDAVHEQDSMNQNL